MNLLAVDGPTNGAKGDGDTATWLPPSADHRCAYVARQVAVKERYELWVTTAERDAMERVLSTCPDEPLPGDPRPCAAMRPVGSATWNPTAAPRARRPCPPSCTARRCAPVRRT